MAHQRVVICEDHNIIIDGLTMMISAHPEYIVSGHAHNEAELLKLLREVQPQILILDINLGTEDGFTILKKVRPFYPTLRVLVLTMHDDPLILGKARRLGANGFLLKSSNSAELLAGLTGIMSDNFYEDPKLRLRIENGHQSRDEFVSKMKLTNREIEIIQLTAVGLKPEVIGERLHLSLHTVRTHKKNIMKKIGVASTSDLVRYAIKNSIV
jgi:DNA-binding NarL/FixJ family response regulator